MPTGTDSGYMGRIYAGPRMNRLMQQIPLMSLLYV